MKNSHPKRILCVGISAPPKSGAESIQFAKYIKAFGKLGISLDLLTTPVPPNGWKMADDDLKQSEKYLDNTYSLDDHSDSLLLRLSKRFGRVTYPDDHYKFGRNLSGAVSLIQHKPDFIYARGMPFSSAQLAAQLAEYFVVPLVLHLADPYSLNPYLQFADHRRARKIEEFCFKQADILAFTTELTRKLYQQQYPSLSDRMRVYPNVFDSLDVRLNTPLPDRFTIRYTGNLYGKRNLQPLIKSLQKISTQVPDFIENTQVIVSGRFEVALYDQMTSSGLDCLHLTDAMPYKSSLQAQQQSHLLVSVDKPMATQEDLVFLPSKLLDYACTGRPILNISSENSESGKFVMKNQLGGSFTHDDIPGISAFIREKYNAYQAGDSSEFNRDSIPSNYSNTSVVASILTELGFTL